MAILKALSWKNEKSQFTTYQVSREVNTGKIESGSQGESLKSHLDEFFPEGEGEYCMHRPVLLEWTEAVYCKF